jgi:hypothetical protein
LQDDVVQKNFNRESRQDRMYDLKSFGLQEMIESGKELRRSASGASSMQQAANRVVDLFYDCFRMGETGESCCALVRCFKTHPLGGLPVAIQRVAGDARRRRSASRDALPCAAGKPRRPTGMEFTRVVGFPSSDSVAKCSHRRTGPDDCASDRPDGP